MRARLDVRRHCFSSKAVSNWNTLSEKLY